MNTDREILIEETDLRCIAVILDHGRLSHLAIDVASRPILAGSVYLGRVVRLSSRMNAAFVDLGGGVTGILEASKMREKRRGARTAGQHFQAGQTVMVQVRGEAGGDKALRLSQEIALIGRYLIHMPMKTGISISRVIKDKSERKRAAALVSDFGSGFIVRSGALAADPVVVKHEARALMRRWGDIDNARSSSSGSIPCKLADGPDAVERILTDSGRGKVDRVEVDGKVTFSDASEWCSDFAPDLLSRVRRYQGSPRLFDLRDVYPMLDTLLTPKVALADGGEIIIEPTSALVSVDVNSGGWSNYFEVNVEAARELARQLRLRNIGGIVVIDFINMSERQAGQRVVEALTAALADDPAQTDVYGMSRLGLVEMTRIRRGTPTAELIKESEEAV
ncbi:MAG: ribonuclease E/G [Pseudomonadota bacterium]|nr:ribonuclease E/G [Pseudomonadota bacterium]